MDLKCCGALWFTFWLLCFLPSVNWKLISIEDRKCNAHWFYSWAEQSICWLVINSLVTDHHSLLSPLAGTIPAKLILQLTTAFRDHGLCNRDGTFFYKDHLHKNNVPVLAIAGDQDLICPPEAVEGILKLYYQFTCLLFS